MKRVRPAQDGKAASAKRWLYGQNHLAAPLCIIGAAWAVCCWWAVSFALIGLPDLALV